MKKILSYTLLLVVSSTLFVGCLKDKGFEDHLYGINDPDTQPVGIGFPEAISKINARSVEYIETNQVLNIPFVNLESGEPAPTDIHVNLVLNQDLVAAYSAANPADSLTNLPSSEFNISSLKVTIPAGSRSVILPINISNAKNLDLTKKYALGFTIASIDEPGYVIADNLKNVLVGVAIRNQYEGDYQATGIFHHPVAGDRDIDEEKFAQTFGPNSVIVNLGDLGASGYQMILTVNPDNTVTIEPAGATPNIDQHWGPNTYDPATKTFTLNYSYNSAAPRIVEETIVRL